MKRSQLLILILAVLAVAGVALVSTGGGGDEGGDGGDTAPAAPEGAIAVPFAYSPEKEKLLVPLIRRFNSEREQVNGRPVFVEGSVVSSGEAQADIAAGEFEPVVWSPASSLWGRLLNFEADQVLAPERTRRSSAPRS
jgi:Ca-activated chloride channel homolog